MIDRLLHWIEGIGGGIQNWAFNKRYKHLKKRAKDPNEWIKGYKEWKKRQCPHK